ncbi:CgeB family protein [Pelotalea chapellei]|uniref:Glycosyltransferase n=1 Tax=Pelotalea chapellei TaxID=44671 RepID=A0ABS5UA62_9BACT|nr:glycosyltransferase [Pelotalea chapellei]MBT1072531.1 glycosyltransferase [Pelotalea chapellei]
MRIFYASETSPNPIFSSNLWRNNLYLPLVDLGHEVVEFDYDLRETFRNVDPSMPTQRAFISRNRPLVTKELLRQLKAAHATKPIDLFFSYFYDACIFPETIDEIRAMGIKTVNWYCNGSYQLHLVSEISPHYDWCLVPEKFRLDDYRTLGARPIYCQEAANPNIYRPFDLKQEFDVTFVGQAYGERPGYIHYLLAQGIDVQVWGYGWEKYASGVANRGLQAARVGRKLLTREGWLIAGRRLNRLFNDRAREVQPLISATVLPPEIIRGLLSDEEMVQMYSRSKINLGFSSCGSTHHTGERILQVRLRDFEVPMSGGFYMVEYMEELEEFYRIGQEIVCYHGPEDLADKIRYFLKHETEREKIRRAGHERCLRDHTWQKRLAAALQEIA